MPTVGEKKITNMSNSHFVLEIVTRLKVFQLHTF